MGEPQLDWQAVVDRNPKGYVELNDGEQALHGPIESVGIDEATDFVVIRLKWMARMPLRSGIPSGGWTAVENTPIAFPNLMVPFTVEDTPNKGPRVRFGLNILYLNEVEGLDPARVAGLKV